VIEVTPDWIAPDGSALMFTAPRGLQGDQQVSVVAGALESNAVTLSYPPPPAPPPQPPQTITPNYISPDGRWLLFVAPPGWGERQVTLENEDGTSNAWPLLYPERPTITIPNPLDPVGPRPDPGGWVVNWLNFNNWDAGWGSPWQIASVDGFPDMMQLKTQDAQLVGDGQVFGWDSEEKRVITLEFRGDGLLLEKCFGAGSAQMQIQEARCANLRRHDDLPLTINDEWVMMARPRRFLAPQRDHSILQMTVSYEMQDPAIYSIHEQSGTALVGVSEWGRPYPPGEDLQYRGPAGTAPNTWRYRGRGESGMLEVQNLGCRETYLRIRIQGPVRYPVIVNQTTFERLELNLDVLDGEWLDIDMRRGTVMLNGVASRYWALTRASTWFSVGPGTTFIRYLARGEVTTSTLTAWWRSAW